MDKKIGYTPTSIFAAVCGTIATAVATTNPATAPYAVRIGTAASAVADGIKLNDKEKNIKDNLDKAMDKAWEAIDKKYRLSLHTEKYTDNCLTELKREVIGKNTSVDEFIRNTEIKGYEPSIAVVIEGILKKHSTTLNRDSEILWSNKFTEDAAKEMASTLVATIKSVFENDDHLRILKAISESEKRIVTELHQATDQVIGEIRNLKPIPAEAPLSLTNIPAVISLIGREKNIQAIYNLLERHNFVFIHADGGVGKTAAAAKIVNQIKDDITIGKGLYKHVAWITSTGDLKSDLTELNIPLVDTMKTPEEKYQIVSTYLQSNPTFLVIDNMDEPPTHEDSNRLNTITGQTKVLITSRADIPYAEEYILVELDPDSALVLFYRHYTRKEMTIEQIRDRKDYSYGENIVKAATYNALFIELIGKMAYADHWKLGDLWEKLSVDVFGVDSKHSLYVTHGDDGKLLEHIQKLYEMSKLSEKQKEIMRFIALFPPEHSILFDVFEWAGFEDDEEDNLGALQDRGWIERGDEGYLIHTMVKGSVEQQDKAFFDEDRYENLINELADTDQYMSVDKGYTVVRERLVVPEKICELLAKQRSEKEVVAKLYNNLALVYYVQGNYDKALENNEKALEIRERVLGKEHPDTATTYNNLALVYYAQGNYDNALEYNKKALEIRERVLGKEHPDTSMTYNNLASVYRARGNYKMAKEYYEKAIAIREKVLGEEHPYTATTYHNLADVYKDQGNYDKALENYNKALSIKEKVYEKEHPEIATAHNNLALVYCDLDSYDKALAHLEKALAIREKVLGKEHPSTAVTYNNLALVYSAQLKYDKALEYFEKALAIIEKVHGKEHPFTATTYNNLASVYRARGNYKMAKEYYENAIAIREKVLGKEHPLTAMTYHNLASVYRAQGNYNEAKEYDKMALAIIEKVHGKKHSYTAMIYHGLASVYHAQGNYDKALEYYNNALRVFEEKLGQEHPHTKRTKEDIENVKKDMSN